MFTPPRLSCRKALAPLGLALLAGLLLPRPARAQWVPCKADGTLLPPSDPGFINDGGTFLVGSSPTPTSTPTGVYDKLTDWWLNAFGPSAASHRNSSLPGLSLDSFADNFASLPYSDSPVGYFAGNNSNLGGEWYSADLPPDITGGVKANSADTLTAYFAWVGSGPVPDHADFLLRTRVGATASVSYGRSASSGLSSSASATLGSDTASATASAPGDAHSQSVPGAHLKRVTASGGVVTVSLSGNVTTDASNSLPYEKWWTQDNRSWYYVGGGNGATSANASGSVSATAYPDSRELGLHRDGAHNETVDPDGTVHGDTIYSYSADYLPPTEEGLPSTEDHENWQVFHPYLTGSWSQRPMINLETGPDINWQWSPDESEDTWNMGKVSMHYRTFRTFNDAPQHQDTSEERDITYTATDNQDGATATATYILTVHDPYEKYIDNPPAPSRENIQRRGSISFTATPAAPTGTSYFEQADSWGASISAAGPLDEWIADILGFRLDLSYSFTVNQGASVNLGPYQPGYGSWAETYDEYTTYTGTAKIYDAGGYCGTQDYYVKVPTGTGIQAHSPAQDMGPVVR